MLLNRWTISACNHPCQLIIFVLKIIFIRAYVFYSVWQPRRVVITKECLLFAFVGNDEEIDRVPLNSVDFVKNFDDTISADTQSQNNFCLQVATNPQGYNSGRSYMLRSGSSSTRDDILSLLSQLSKHAKKRAKARTGFQMLQVKVKKYYEKDFCQSFIALIIMTASAPPSPNPKITSGCPY